MGEVDDTFLLQLRDELERTLAKSQQLQRALFGDAGPTSIEVPETDKERLRALGYIE